MEDLSPEERRRRERLVIDTYGGIQPIFEAFYLEGIRYAANCAMEAFERYDDAIESRNKDAVVAHVHEALAHAAAVSRFFWPPGKESNLRSKRAAKLREAFKLGDTSPLADRNIRNALEHFDERLDEYLLGDNAGYTFPAPMVAPSDLVDDELGHIFRLVDPRKSIFVLCGEKFEFGPIRDAVSTVLHGAAKTFSGGGRLGDRSSESVAPPEGPVPQHLREDFRTLAKVSLGRAKAELATNNDERLRYACIELRLALEDARDGVAVQRLWQALCYFTWRLRQRATSIVGVMHTEQRRFWLTPRR